MKLSILTDEVSADLETSLELAQTWGLEAIELRGVGEQRYPDVSEFWKVRVPELIQESGLSVAALSPGLFKIPYPFSAPSDTRILRWEDYMLFQRFRNAEALVKYHLETLLPMSIQAARLLKTDTIVCFSFDRGHDVDPETPVPEPVVEVLGEAARKVGQAGLTLALEVEHICWGDTGLRTAQLVERVSHPALGINWDPANAFRAGEDRPYPDGYSAVRPFVKHVHFKDAGIDKHRGERRFVYDGVVDWEGQLSALKQDGYEGYLSIETHVRPKVEMARRTIERVRHLLEEVRI